jgi:hypothetical protein
MGPARLPAAVTGSLSVAAAAVAVGATVLLALLSAPFRYGCGAAGDGPLQQYGPIYEVAALFFFVALWAATGALGLTTAARARTLGRRLGVCALELGLFVAVGAVGLYAAGLIQFLLNACL